MRSQPTFLIVLVMVVVVAAAYAIFNRPQVPGTLDPIRSVGEFESGIQGRPASMNGGNSSTQGDGPDLVLVKFGATWCPPCQAIDAELIQLKQSHQGKVGVIKVDVDMHPALADRFDVSGIPRLFLFKQGSVVDDKVGYYSHDELVDWVSSPDFASGSN